MSEVNALVEGALFMAGRKISVREIAEVVGAPAEEVKGIIESLAAEYAGRESSIIIEFSGKSASMHLREDIEDEIMTLAPATSMNKAMLKTLAVIATEGPVKQSDLVKRRGNRVYYYVKRLLDQELISAKKAGRSKMLSVTGKFKDYFRIKEVPKVEAPAALGQEPEVEQKTGESSGQEPEVVDNEVKFDMK